MHSNSFSDMEPEKVARLVGLTLEAEISDKGDPDQQIAESLVSHLEAPWPKCDGGDGLWSALIARLLGTRERESQRSLKEHLLDGRTKLGVIKAIRRHAKETAAKESFEAEHAAITTVYFAAIAHALAFHGTKITTYSHESLRSSFTKLLAKSWMPKDLAELFNSAVQICDQQGKALSR